MADTKKKLEAIPTIDVSLIVIRTGTSGNYVEYAVDTSNKLGVEPQTETTDAIKLVKLNRIIAQKPQRTVITGHQLTLTDNVFSPTLAKILQGGEISGSLETDDFTYTPPVSGSDDKGEVFELDAYSAQYDASGQIVRYEKQHIRTAKEHRLQNLWKMMYSVYLSILLTVHQKQEKHLIRELTLMSYQILAQQQLHRV